MKSHKVPENFTHIFQSKLFLLGLSSSSNYSVVGNEGLLGRRYTVGPLCVEYYTGDKEPELSTWRGFRFVIWNPVSRLDVPPSWFHLPLKSDHSVSAFLNIQNCDTYFKTWKRVFRNYYHRWSQQSEYIIKEVGVDEYVEQYSQYAIPKKFISRNVELIKSHSFVSGNSVHFYVLKYKEKNEIVAGIAVIDYFSVYQSYYIAAFTRKDISPKEAGLWLCNYWMNESSKRGLSYANLGVIFTEGQPESWKGFSEFKMKFNPQFIVLQQELVRFTFSL